MNASIEHVLPRPVSRLPDYSPSRARQALAEKLKEAFRLSDAAASAISDAVVDPADLRKTIGDPTSPQAERIAVPGGMLLGVRTEVWSRKVMPDPRNPRLLPSRRHPFAVPPGTGAEDSKFAPVPEPHSASAEAAGIGELYVDIENREHLTWAVQQAAGFVLAENNWSASIASQGVMEAVWLVATTYNHADGTEPATALTSVEGSSRITSTHSLLEVRSSDVPYEDADAKMRAHLRKLNDSYQRGPSAKDMIALRCEIIPALLLVGFVPYPGGTAGFPTAVKSLVALRHVDPPTPWGDGPQNEALADEVLDEVFRRDLITPAQRDYYGGSCTREQAVAAHLSADPCVRSSHIMKLFTSNDQRIEEAIRVAVTSQSTRKNITAKLRNELATALILRASAEDVARNDQIRRYLRHAYGQAVHDEPWNDTDRDVDVLAAAALQEVRAKIAADDSGEPGRSSLELAVRAAYALIASGRLNADRGTANNEQPDRRTPGQVLDAMRRTPQGVYQLAQALRDFTASTPIRAVDESGELLKTEEGGEFVAVNDVYLRVEFPPPGRPRGKRPGDTPMDRYQNAIAKMSEAAEALQRSFVELSDVVGDDGQPMVESRGLDNQLCGTLRSSLADIDESLVLWGSTFRKKVARGSISLGASSPTADASDRDTQAWDQELAS